MNQPIGQGSPMINYRKDAKKAVKFTFMVAGELGTGKTTFVNCLLDRKVMSHTFEGRGGGNTKTITFTLAQNVALPNTSTLARNEFDAYTAHEEPGIALTETAVEILDEENMRMQLNILDTPGFGDNLNNEICMTEIENYLKQQFDSVLAEETRIRRNPRFVDTRVHVLLYFIAPTGHGLRELDVTCMKRLAKYVNIIPVIGRADSFTPAELKNFKTQIKVDIEKFNIPVFQFDTFLADYDEDEDLDLIEECKFLTNLQPFAIIASEQEFEVKDTMTGASHIVKARQYPWGLANVNNPSYSDFPILKSVILGSHLQDLKDITHDFLYETYRTERLSKVTGNQDPDMEDSIQPPQTVLSAIPSLSNLALLTGNNDVNFADQSSVVSTVKGKSMLLDDDTVPTPPLRDDVSYLSTASTVSDVSSRNNLHERNGSFKRLSIAPQRHQLRQISETVPYVLRHEQIVEKQQKLEEMEVASARELASRAAILEQKALQLKNKEKALLAKLEAFKAKKAQDVEGLTYVEEDVGKKSLVEDRKHSVPRDETLTDLHSVVSGN